MDMWGWTYEVDDELRDSGQDKLADYMERIPHDTVNGHHQKIDKYADEAIALAREVGHPWVEIFLRHWRLQSAVLHRQKPKDMIKEAVSLLEFAHRPDNEGCPQSVCVVQDLANCYGAFDGPGFADERIDVCKENFARINPSWSCYSCIGGEYARALLDAERYDECLELLDQCDRELIEAGEGKDTGELLLVRILAHAQRGECDAARKYADIAKNPMGGKAFKNQLATTRAYVEMCDGHFQKALEMLPPFKQVKLHTTIHYWWAEVLYRACLDQPELLNAENLELLEYIADDMEQRGTYRQSLLANSWLVDVYRRNQDTAKATKAIDAMKRAQAQLNKDLGAAAMIEALEKA